MNPETLKDPLDLPENKECADCKSIGPRWVSVNLGIFLCVRCALVHDTLGVKVPKRWCPTLDASLPEEVAIIEIMGNERSNSYWEAELPPNYNRFGIENFIRAKYEDKRWVSKDRKLVSSSSLCATQESTHVPLTGPKQMNSRNYPQEQLDKPLLYSMSRPSLIDKPDDSDKAAHAAHDLYAFAFTLVSCFCFLFFELWLIFSGDTNSGPVSTSPPPT